MINKNIYYLALILGAITFCSGIIMNESLFTIASVIIFLICFVIVVIYLTQKANRSSKNVIENSEEIEKTDAEAEFELKGLNFTDADQLIIHGVLVENSYITVMPEPNNQYDANAMIVSFKGNTIGYVDKENAESIKELFNQGFSNGYIQRIRSYKNDSTSEPYFYVLISLPFKY